MGAAVRLGVCGFSEHDTLLIRSLLTILDLDRSRRWLPVEGLQCDVLILNAASMAAREYLQQAPAERPLLLCYGHLSAAPERRLLVFSPPMRSRGLLRALEEAAALLEAPAVPAKPVAPISRPARAATVRLPDDPDLPPVYRAESDAGVLWVDRLAERYTARHAADTEDLLWQFASGACAIHEADALPVPEHEALVLDALSWRLLSLPAVMPGLATDVVAGGVLWRLKRWPSADVLTLDRGYARLCAALSKRALDTASLMQVTALSEARVRHFLAVANRLGLLTVQSGGRIADVSAPVARRGLFARIRQRLGMEKEV